MAGIENMSLQELRDYAYELEDRARRRHAYGTHIPDALMAAGDLLQSSASRLAEWVLKEVATNPGSVPYEVHTAALEAQGAVDDWTQARKGTV